MKILFIDIDGVLNNHQPFSNGYCGIDPECVTHLNTILEAVPDAQLVISSAWRYMIHPEAMTLKGFSYLLLVCGVCCYDRVAGHTVRDEEIEKRADQIYAWVEKHGVKKYAVLDDLDLGMPDALHVRTNGEVGLTAELVQRVIEILS